MSTPTLTDDRRPQLQAAYSQLARVIHSVSPDELRLPTPCTEWDVAGLVDHAVFASRRAAALADGRADTVESEHLDRDAAVLAVRAAAADAAARWTDANVARVTTMPWGVDYRGSQLVDMYLMELVTHTWDLAHAVGRGAMLDDELAEAAFVAGRPLAPPEYRGDPADGMPFAPEVDADDGRGAYDRLAAFLGRNPA
ncbi:TIGR03086 family protein [Acidiferrimicrobium sp. IK]|uniref:TIGR03086 family metal-binding protein n=1 Tax=Acidiferrimicrobium sp. IK TaxID=2871700 RepID=UPI0021CAFB14|nr:TIGR03086 family metal-binding protein [Acidiferrimicrobium sp. IK]MCU4185979.1 TIGR03086 family protein [Acidiferrimicrobium sp. IK]